MLEATFFSVLFEKAVEIGAYGRGLVIMLYLLKLAFLPKLLSRSLSKADGSSHVVGIMG